jgi:capsular polysaccharide biosynthesis protein
LDGPSASLLQLGWGNYYHWLLQGLPRLIAILRVAERRNIKRFLAGPMRPFVSECLDRLQIDRSQVEEIPSHSPAIRCELLLSANLPRHEAPSPRWAVDAVRNLFADAESESARPRIYLSRGTASRRRVVNELEVVDMLRRLGFVDLRFDNMTVAEQAAAIRGAAVVVAPHGAALTNLVFARAGTRVIEIIPANNPQPFFWHLSDRVKLDYEAVIGREPALRRRHEVRMNDADILVDVDELERAVDATIEG